MICFGTAVGPRGSYERLTLPSILAVAEPGAGVFAVRDPCSLTSAYNSLIRQALDFDDVEALVLLHDDVVIQDRNFLPRIRRLLRDPALGVVGVIGGRNLRAMGFWTGDTQIGRAWDGVGFHGGSELRGDVDAVDGLLMILSRRALKEVRFDEETFPAFHGYDSDYCLACKKAGLRVVVEPFVLFHQSGGDHAIDQYLTAEAAFIKKWKGQLAPPRSDHLRLVRTRVRRLRTAFEPGVEEVRGMALRGFHRLRPGRYGRGLPEEASVSDSLPPSTSAPAPACVLCSAPTNAPSPVLPLVVCDACGLGRTWPDPQVDHSSAEIFDSAYGGLRGARRSEWLSQANQRMSWIETFVPEGLLVEVGSATGEFVTVASERGYEACGVETSEWAAGMARDTGAEVMLGTLHDWAEEYNGFTVDAIAMFHVLEHVDSPAELLKQSMKALTDGGMLFIEVPNAGSRQALELDRSWLGWSFWFHRWHFTLASLARLLEDAGFQILELRPITRRPYAVSKGWEAIRAAERAGGNLVPNLDFLRVAARRPPTIH